jgi:ubiquinone/menaquinone biosynthesis C-methylase UbiE
MYIRTWCLILCMLYLCLPLDAQDLQSAQDEKSAQQDETKSGSIPEGRDTYYGRTIATTMHWSGAEWLIRDEREREERSSLMWGQLGIKPGMTICDMGCGNGFHTLKLAEMTGPNGVIYGVDIQAQMLKLLRDRVEQSGNENVIPVLGSVHTPRLPPDSMDLILMVDVYHEFSHPELMLAALRKSLKKDGLIVLVEFRLEDDDVPIQLLHRMSKEQIMKEYEPNGFKLVKEFDRLPWQHMMFFGKAEKE